MRPLIPAAALEVIVHKHMEDPQPSSIHVELTLFASSPHTAASTMHCNLAIRHCHGANVPLGFGTYTSRLGTRSRLLSSFIRMRVVR